MIVLTRSRAMELLDYNQDTGLFVWKVQRRRARKGAVAGYLDGGYRCIGMDYDIHLAHRLAWLFVYGHFPRGDIDHINGIKSDNRICNLREVTNQENQQNVFAAGKNSVSGIRGVRQHANGKWVAYISINNKSTHLGYFPTKELAANAYLESKKLHHPVAFYTNLKERQNLGLDRLHRGAY